MSLIYIYELFDITASLYQLHHIFVELTHKSYVFEHTYDSAYVAAILYLMISWSSIPFQARDERAV